MQIRVRQNAAKAARAPYSGTTKTMHTVRFETATYDPQVIREMSLDESPKAGLITEDHLIPDDRNNKNVHQWE